MAALRAHVWSTPPANTVNTTNMVVTHSLGRVMSWTVFPDPQGSEGGGGAESGPNTGSEGVLVPTGPSEPSVSPLGSSGPICSFTHVEADPRGATALLGPEGPPAASLGGYGPVGSDASYLLYPPPVGTWATVASMPLTSESGASVEEGQGSPQ